MNNMSASNNPKTVEIAKLSREQTQLRAVMDDAAVESYAEVYNNRKSGSDRMPPVTVYESESGELFLVDGFHRVAAKLKLDQATIPAIIEPGSLDDAIIAAAKVNLEHKAVRWTNADKRNAAKVLIERFPSHKTRDLAELAGCSHRFIGMVKKELKGERTPLQKGRVLKKPKATAKGNPVPAPDDCIAATAELNDAEITVTILELMRKQLGDQDSTDAEIVTRWSDQYGQRGAA